MLDFFAKTALFVTKIPKFSLACGGLNPDGLNLLLVGRFDYRYVAPS
jgi:hypothetical protein